MKNLDEKLQFFKKCALDAIKFFNMEDCSFEFFEEKDGDFNAMCKWRSINDQPFSSHRKYSIIVNAKWITNKNISKEEIKRTAMHEVLEAWLSRLSDYAMNTDIVVPTRNIDDEIHKIIRLMENKFLNVVYKKEEE